MSHSISSHNSSPRLRIAGSLMAPVLSLLFLVVGASGHGAGTNRVLVSWIGAQTNIQTWSADVTQTRRLKTLAQPLVAQGRVWFSAPNRFRWELGNPAQTIAFRQPDEVVVIYPRLRRVERFPLKTDKPSPWKDTLALLDAGFPRNAAGLEERFNLLSEEVADGVCTIALQPKAPSARRLMPEIKVVFATNDFSLRATELQFADGSRMRNEFSNARLNPPLADAIFTPPLDPSYKIVEPFAR